MREIIGVSATFDASALLPLPLMDRNQQLRKRVAHLIELGVKQRVVADKMGLTTSTFSRWLNDEPGINPVSTNAHERFDKFEDEFRSFLCEETQRTGGTQPASAGGAFPKAATGASTTHRRSAKR